MITAVELELAAAHPEALGTVADAVAPSLAEPGRPRRSLEALDRRRGRQRRMLTSADLRGHGAGLGDPRPAAA